jgi:hypothetical protein
MWRFVYQKTNVAFGQHWLKVEPKSIFDAFIATIGSAEDLRAASCRIFREELE